ncbi:MAG: hypothetical protein EXS39_02640 [Opitutaceae bacterium]|nr:hypothetical protein [Opitutaceae bacterium]
MIPLLIQIPAADLNGWCKRPAWPPSALQGVAALSLAQTWLDRPQPEFRPGRVWLATTPACFIVLAELLDDDIVTMGRKHNDPLWDLGDVFEVFVRHTQRPEYYEFHVAPNGVTLDLRYPRLYASREQGVEQYMLDRPHFTSRVSAEPKLGRWRVAVEIPVTSLVRVEFFRTESEWQFSFSRYDCGPQRPPAVSSTSPHRVAGFHRAEEWRHFRARPFAAG